VPVDRKDIEIRKEVPGTLTQMKRGKFYTEEELYEMEYGMAFDDKTTGELWSDYVEPGDEPECGLGGPGRSWKADHRSQD